jgi:hypothetical protein
VSSAEGGAPVRGRMGAHWRGWRGQRCTLGRSGARGGEDEAGVGHRGLAPGRSSQSRKAVGSRGVEAVRWCEEESKWDRASPLQSHAVDKGARGRRPRWSLGRRYVAEHLSHVHEASDRAPFKRRLRLTSGPWHFFIYQDFQTPTF